MYGVMFTCLCSRAIHIEAAQSLETDSFIFLLRREDFEKPSNRWIIIKYHNIYKDVEPTG